LALLRHVDFGVWAASKGVSRGVVWEQVGKEAHDIVADMSEQGLSKRGRVVGLLWRDAWTERRRAGCSKGEVERA